MFLEIKSRETSGLEGKQSYWFPEGPYPHAFEFDRGHVTKT